MKKFEFQNKKFMISNIKEYNKILTEEKTKEDKGICVICSQQLNEENEQVVFGYYNKHSTPDYPNQQVFDYFSTCWH